MNVESFGYAVLSTVVGMAIVFFFLVILSLLMVVIRWVFGTRSSPVDSSEAATTNAQRDGNDAPAEVLSGGVPRWAVAAALVYLSEEEREYRPQSGPWALRRSQ